MNSFEDFLDDIDPISIPSLESIYIKLHFAISLNEDNFFNQALDVLADLVIELLPFTSDFEPELLKVLIYMALTDIYGVYTKFLRDELGKYLDKITNMGFSEPWCALYYRTLHSLIIDCE